MLLNNLPTPDFYLLGICISFHRINKYWPHFFYAKQMFHNGQKFIPGCSLSFLTIGIDFSLKRYWLHDA